MVATRALQDNILPIYESMPLVPLSGLSFFFFFCFFVFFVFLPFQCFFVPRFEIHNPGKCVYNRGYESY